MTIFSQFGQKLPFLGSRVAGVASPQSSLPRRPQSWRLPPLILAIILVIISIWAAFSSLNAVTRASLRLVVVATAMISGRGGGVVVVGAVVVVVVTTVVALSSSLRRLFSTSSWSRHASALRNCAAGKGLLSTIDDVLSIGPSPSSLEEKDVLSVHKLSKYAVVSCHPWMVGVFSQWIILVSLKMP